MVSFKVVARRRYGVFEAERHVFKACTMIFEAEVAATHQNTSILRLSG